MILMGIKLKMALWESASLKSKRKVIRSMIDKIHHHFHLSASEVGLNDVVDYAEIGIGVVSNDARHAEQVLKQVENYIEAHFPVEIISLDRYEDR